MRTHALLIALLALSVWTTAQTTQSAPATQQNPQVIQSAPAPGGLNPNTGAAVIISPPPVAVTPEFHLTTVNPGIGATNATPGNIAGAFNSTTEMPVVPRIVTTVPQFSTAGVSFMQTLLTPENSGTGLNSGTGTAPPGNSGTGAPLVVNHKFVLDRGVGSGGVAEAGNVAGRSLGEIARQNRQHEANLNARVYTNQDINRINSQPGLTLGGISGAAVAAGNPAPQPPSGNAPAVSQPISNQPSNPGISEPASPSNTPPHSEAIPPSPLGQPQAQREMAQNQQPASPAGQSGQSSSVDASSGQATHASSPQETRRGQRQLPSAASILPLVALVGVLAAGAGLLSR